jgi:hypothetical protein
MHTSTNDSGPLNPGNSWSGTFAAADVLALVVLPVNALSIYVASMWSMSSWRENLHERGYWSYWPLIWLIGSAVLLAAQLLLSIAPTVYVVSPHRCSLSRGVRMLVLFFGLAGAVVTIGGFVRICWYNYVTPLPHAIGM